jgi:riboflavin kinase/FMN adenylyltransferase
MRVVRELNALRDAGPRSCLAIGFFDGVHLGHQQVIRQMIADARAHEAAAVVVTFDAHPNTVVAPERAPQLIYPLEKKLAVIGQLGADAAWLIRFDGEFSRKTGEAFIRELVRAPGSVPSLCVGGNFTFGHRRGGDVALLRRLGTALGFKTHALASVALDGQPVSSTRIRDAIRTGDLDAAGQMLGRAYSLCGPVVRGDGVGRKLGFPTANVFVEDLVTPPRGVYGAHVTVDGVTHRAALNIGMRPTLGSPEPKLQVEAHLLDFEGDLYSRTVEVEFVARLRDEQKFPSLDALKAQIARDIESARSLFG